MCTPPMGGTATRARRVPLSFLRFAFASEQRAHHAGEAALALNHGRGTRRIGLVLLRIGRLARLGAARIPLLLSRAARLGARVARRQLLAFCRHARAGFPDLVFARRNGRRMVRTMLPLALRLAIAATLTIAATLAIAFTLTTATLAI